MGLTLCNSYSAPIWTVIMFYSPDTCGGDGGNFEMMGWWGLAPGSCALVYANDLEDLNRYWFYFAEADDGAVWAGPWSAAVPDTAFNQCYGVGVSFGEQIGFRELDVGDNDDYTLTFVA